MKRLLPLIVLFVAATPLTAQSLAEQKMCSDAAKAYFQEAYGRLNVAEKGTVFFIFSSHYNQRLNRCLINIRITFLDKGKNTGYNVTVLDVFERVTYASYTEFFDKRSIGPCDSTAPEDPAACRSRWERLVEMLMQE
jgi:hypothetical protein